MNNKELRKFGILMALFFFGIFGIVHPLLKHTTIPILPWIVGLTFLILAFLVPRSLIWLYRVWVFLGRCLGYVNSRIILSGIFVLVLFPTAFVLRIFGRRP